MILEYKYFLANLFGLLPLGAALLLAGRLRNTALLCGAILCLYSPPVALMYERVYWTPGRIFGGGWGLEDVMFCFHAGAISWLCALGPWGGRVQSCPTVAVTLRRLFLVTSLAVMVLMGLLMAGLDVPSAFLLTQTLSTATLLIMRPSYLRLVVSGIPLFTAYYFILLAVWRHVMPNFMGMWNGSELIGARLLGVPVDEYLWVLSFCTGFPITMAFAFDMKIVSPSQAIAWKTTEVL